MKIYPPIENPTEDDCLKAEKMVIPADVGNRLYTDHERREINRVARVIMMRRKTIQ